MTKYNFVCKFCKKKVHRVIDVNFMIHKNNFFHYDCVLDYGYQKFCMEIINEEKQEIINNNT